MLEYAPQGGSTCLSTAKMAEVQSVQDDYPVSDDYILRDTTLLHN